MELHWIWGSLGSDVMVNLCYLHQLAHLRQSRLDLLVACSPGAALAASEEAPLKLVLFQPAEPPAPLFYTLITLAG